MLKINNVLFILDVSLTLYLSGQFSLTNILFWAYSKYNKQEFLKNIVQTC